jgi:hypothetical protein
MALEDKYKLVGKIAGDLVFICPSTLNAGRLSEVFTSFIADSDMSITLTLNFTVSKP